MLTLKENGKAIAIVHGGIDDGEIISIVDDNRGDGKPNELMGYYGYGEDESDDDDINDKYFEIEDGDPGVLVPLPSFDTRSVTYVAGPAGAGKSTYAAGQAEKYRKIFPGSPIYIFSRLDSDPAFDGKFNPPPTRMKIDNTLLTHPIDITKQLKPGCLVIFDDIDTIQDDKLKKAVLKLENDILEVGRHQNIYIICCCHLINSNDKKFSRTILNEATTITVFPKSGSSYQISYMLKNYFGLNKKQIEEILKMPSRWLTFYKGYPQAVCSEKSCYLLG